MRNLKRLFALTMSILMACGVAACSNSSSSSGSSEESFEATDNVEVQENMEIEAIPDGAEKTIRYLGENDLNPTKSNPEISTELKLFQQKGGSIEWTRCTNEGRFDALAKAIAAKSEEIPAEELF